MSITAVVISYKNPAYLDLCLKSLTENKTLSDTQIIVVLDGFAEMSEAVVNKYPGINVLAFEENKGQTAAHNEGVLAAQTEWVLLLNDDNVAPLMWDEELWYACKDSSDCVISPNQIEPAPSIFPSFVIKDLGTTPETFRYQEFLSFEDDVVTKRNHAEMPKFTKDGSTWPLFIRRKHYAMLNGIDPAFPSPAVADWDLFYRAQLAGLGTLRYMGLNFYHFAGVATKKQDAGWNHKEYQSMEYFRYKWGFWPQRDRNNNIIKPSHMEISK